MKRSSTHRKQVELPGVSSSYGYGAFWIPPLRDELRNHIQKILDLSVADSGDSAFLKDVEYQLRRYTMNLAEAQGSMLKRQLMQIRGQASRLHDLLFTIAPEAGAPLREHLHFSCGVRDPMEVFEHIRLLGVAAHLALRDFGTHAPGRPSSTLRDNFVAELVAAYKKRLRRDALSEPSGRFRLLIDALFAEVRKIEGLPNRPAPLGRKARGDAVLRGYKLARERYAQLWEEIP